MTRGEKPFFFAQSMACRRVERTSNTRPAPSSTTKSCIGAFGASPFGRASMNTVRMIAAQPSLLPKNSDRKAHAAIVLLCFQHDSLWITWIIAICQLIETESEVSRRHYSYANLPPAKYPGQAQCASRVASRGLSVGFGHPPFQQILTSRSQRSDAAVAPLAAHADVVKREACLRRVDLRIYGLLVLGQSCLANCLI